MKFKTSGEFFEPGKENVEEWVRVMEELMPSDYEAYILHVDSLYPVTGCHIGNVGENSCSLSSEESYGKKGLALTVVQLMEEMKMLLEGADEVEQGLYAEAAANCDPDLDMQLTEAHRIEGWALDESNRQALFLTGRPWEWC